MQITVLYNYTNFQLEMEYPYIILALITADQHQWVEGKPFGKLYDLDS